MTKIELKDTSLDKGATGYLELCQACLRAAPPKGLDLEGMERRLRVLNALEEASRSKTKTAALEDADAETLRQTVLEFRWSGAHPELLEFLKYIRDLKPEKKR